MSSGIGFFELLMIGIIGLGCLGAICIPVILIFLANPNKKRRDEGK